jgi:hypothetical protein
MPCSDDRMQTREAQPGTTPAGRDGRRLAAVALVCLALLGCDQRDPGAASSAGGALVIDELMTDNDAAWVDEAGETEDFIELANVSQRPLALQSFALRDSGKGEAARLPAYQLRPGERIVLFADGEPEQGPRHLPFKLSAQGEGLQLLDAQRRVVDDVEIPALDVNVAYARLPSGHGHFTQCRYATPERDNGEECGPPEPLELPEDTSWKPYAWPAHPFAPRGPLVLSELALLPARFIEVLNAGDGAIDLADFQVRLAPMAPARPWPTADEGTLVAWPDGARRLEPGERALLELDDAATAEIAGGAFEGVATIYDADGEVSDRVDFMRWPSGSALARSPDADGPLRFCQKTTPGEANDGCDPLPARDVGDRVRHLYTPGDFAALAAGDSQLGVSSVKFVVDLQAPDSVHLLGTRAWALHYTFIRERIDGDPPLDRCDPAQSALFNAGWYAFSREQYDVAEGRRYLLGTLDVHAGSGLRTLDFTFGDQVIGPQMKHAFEVVIPHLDAEDPAAWSLRPVEPRQVVELRRVDGEVPIVAQNAPFRGLRYQPLTTGVAYGTLVFLRADELEHAALGPDTIVVTDGVPNDIPFVAGLITEAFQTPLAHVNVLSQNRGTPNMALRGARDDERIAPFLDELVRLEVTASGFSVDEASAEDADTFWKSREPSGPRIAPRRDLSVRGVVDLAARGLGDLPAIGAKAAQLAELGHVDSQVAGCAGALPIPLRAFAIPIAHYAEHFEKSGAQALLRDAMDDAEFRADPEVRERGLARVRDAITSAPVDAKLLDAVKAAIAERFGDGHVRFRSSSNTEDLPGFNGAGLYESLNGELDDDDNTVEDAIRGVWASLWNTRAYDEREFGHIDQEQVGMGVLVHAAFVGERANVIAISRDVLDPTRSDIHYVNAQIGEASVALPAPGVATEQLAHHKAVFSGMPENEYQSKSSLTHGADVLTADDVRAVSCRLQAIHDHFSALIDPHHEDRWFAMDVEMKVVGDDRQVVVKQARPYSFARADVPADCREF